MDTSSRRQTYAGRFYEVEDGTRFPSVTTILGAINKPALVNWAAKEERTMVLECSANLYLDVAEITKMSRMAWLTTMEFRLGKQKAHSKLLAKAGDIGTQAHNLVEWTLRDRLKIKQGPRPQACDKAEWAFMAWEDWAKSVNLKPKFVEQVVYSRKHGYAGTMDLYCELEVQGLIDYFKRKNREVPEVLTEMVKAKPIAIAIPDWKTGKAIYEESHLQNAAYRQAWREMGHGDSDLGLLVRLPKNENDPEFEVVVADPEPACFATFLHVKSLWTWMQIGEARYQARKKAAEQVSTQAPAGGVTPQAAPPAATQSHQPATRAAAEDLPQGEVAAAPPLQKKARTRKVSVPKAQLTPPIKKNGEPLPLAADDPLNQSKPAYVATNEDCPF